tara:strand:+ start:57 stop:749 length:693 start_codon:yes stop_codon:yes gene_type:complete
MIKEELARKNLSEAITTIGHPITVKVKRTNSGGYYTFDKVVSTDTVEGTPKADFALVNTKGNHVCWISHKAAGDASSFQQYSGISSKSGKRIYENDEVQSFMRRVIPYIKNDKLQKPIMSSINSSTLVSYAVYGPDFGKEFGEDNCHLIGQGTPKLTRHRTKDDCYYLTWENGHHTNGDVVGLRGGYEPYFAATYRSGRGFFVDGERYVGARLGIVPKSFIHRRLHVVDV